MRNWEHFPLDEPRPEVTQIFKPNEREELERVVAEQVALLLSVFGRLTQLTLDMSACVEIEDPSTYQFLETNGVVLEDHSEVSITQLPLVRNRIGTDPEYESNDSKDENVDPDINMEWDSTPGLYSFELTDEDDEPIMTITVHHPSHEARPLVYYYDHDWVEMEVLQEMYEFLGVVTSRFLLNEVQNVPPLDSSCFPVRVSDLEFESIIAHLRPDDFGQEI